MHELTTELCSGKPLMEQDIDLIICAWLEEKAKEIVKHCCIEKVNFLSEGVYKILGLETEKTLKDKLVEKFNELHPLNYEHLAEVAVDFFRAESQKENKVKDYGEQ